jgi:hypothetical protein
MKKMKLKAAVFIHAAFRSNPAHELKVLRIGFVLKRNEESASFRMSHSDEHFTWDS